MASRAGMPDGGSHFPATQPPGPVRRSFHRSASACHTCTGDAAAMPAGKSRLAHQGPRRSLELKLDRHARFVQPNRLVISFTAPNGKHVEAVLTSYANGYVTMLSMARGPQLKRVRIWKRVEQTSRKSPQFPPAWRVNFSSQVVSWL